MRINRRLLLPAALLAPALLSGAGARAYAAVPVQRSEQQHSQASPPPSDPRPAEAGTPVGARAMSLEELRREQSRAPRSPASNYKLGAALYAAGRYDEAAEYLSRAVRLDANFVAPRRALGLTYFRLARYGDAAVVFKELTRLQPRLAEGHNNLGVAYAKARKYKEAVAPLREAVALDPTYAEARYNLGAVLALTSDRDAAVEQHAALLKLDPALADRLFRVIHRDKLVYVGSK
jgi:tetratricopeptide (TPR) repeat protein